MVVGLNDCQWLTMCDSYSLLVVIMQWTAERDMRDTCFICSRGSYDFEHHGMVCLCSSINKVTVSKRRRWNRWGGARPTLCRGVQYWWRRHFCFQFSGMLSAHIQQEQQRVHAVSFS